LRCNLKDKFAFGITLIGSIVFILSACQAGKSTLPTSTSTTKPAAISNAVQRINGTLESINGNHLVVTTTSGQVSVNVTSGTVINQTRSGTVTDLKQGQSVLVTGSSDTAGNIAATSLTVRTAGPGLDNRTNRPGNYFNPGSSSPGNSIIPGFPGISGNILTGTINKINGNKLTLDTVQGQSEITVGKDTAIQITENRTVADLHSGQSLTITTNRDTNNEISAISITIQISDTGSTPPSPTTGTKLEIFSAGLSGRVGVPYSRSLVVSGGIPPYQWSVINGSLPDGLSLESDNATITGTPSASGTFNFTISVIDNKSTGTAKLYAVIGPATIGDSFQLPSGNVGVPYNHQLAGTTLNGFPRNYSWVISPGSLPDGLSFDPQAATISGTPSEVGRFSFTANLSGATDHTQTLIMTIEIHKPPAIDTGTLPDGQVGIFYTQPLIPSGGTIPYIWNITAGSLPDGLSLDSTASSIMGWPTVTGTYNFTVSLTDAVGEIVTQALSLKINPSPDKSQP
jgi:hypothetical protein